MKSMNKFTSSETIKNLHELRGGVGDPVYLGWSETDGGADERLMTKGGTGDCDGLIGNADCEDETYTCGGVIASGGGSASGNASGLVG